MLQLHHMHVTCRRPERSNSGNSFPPINGSFMGKRTERLEYEAYVPMAAKKLQASAGSCLPRGARVTHAAAAELPTTLLEKGTPLCWLSHARTSASKPACGGSWSAWQWPTARG